MAAVPSAGGGLGSGLEDIRGIVWPVLDSPAMDSRAVTLRLARAADARTMAVMSRDLIEAGLPWRYHTAHMLRLMGDDETIALVAHDADGIQGFAVMQFGDERAHLVLLCVRPPLQRRGIGRRLLDWLLASARVAGMARVQLELRADNPAAHRFYRAQGFEDNAWLPGYYDGLVAARRMALALRAPPPAG
jgi:ribosomal protein S18 acetylase RimI-like enzyme